MTKVMRIATENTTKDGIRIKLTRRHWGKQSRVR
jgi:hypothetical protein